MPIRCSAWRSNASGSTTPSGSVCSCMSTSAEPRYSTVAKPWLKVRAASIRWTSACGIGCAGLVVAGEAVERLGRQHPILVHLARIFDEVARRRRQARIVHVDQEIMDGVAEFVEQGLGVVEADQHRLARPGLGEIVVVRAEDDVVAEQAGAGPIAGHPGARALARAREHVAVEDADILAGAVGDPPGPDVRMPDRHLAGILVEVEAVELPRHVEHALDHVGRAGNRV